MFNKEWEPNQRTSYIQYDVQFAISIGKISAEHSRETEYMRKRIN